MRRALVLTNESARHPIRRMIPASSMVVKPVGRQRSDPEFVKTFLLTFTAGFLGFYSFIA
ncbi:MAG: hypothetical protein ABL918_07795 [Chakrabartia sp.]